MSPVLVVVVHTVVGIAVPPIVFYLFKSPYNWIDLVIASVVAALVQLIPLVGGTLSMFLMGGILYWRAKPDIVPDVIVAVVASRFAMVGVFLAIRLHT